MDCLEELLKEKETPLTRFFVMGFLDGYQSKPNGSVVELNKKDFDEYHEGYMEGVKKHCKKFNF